MDNLPPEIAFLLMEHCCYPLFRALSMTCVYFYCVGEDLKSRATFWYGHASDALRKDVLAICSQLKEDPQSKRFLNVAKMIAKCALREVSLKEDSLLLRVLLYSSPEQGKRVREYICGGRRVQMAKELICASIDETLDGNLSPWLHDLPAISDKSFGAYMQWRNVSMTLDDMSGVHPLVVIKCEEGDAFAQHFLH